MKSLTINRHQSLKPLSRDHGVGLVFAQRLHKAVRASTTDRLRLAEQIRAVFSYVIASYLEDEQRILFPVVSDNLLTAQLQERHNNVRGLLTELDAIEPAQDPGLGLLSRIADVLDDYVRWEEHSLFPAIEDILGLEELDKLTEVTSAIEANRTRPTQQLHSSVALDKQSGLAETCACSKTESV